MKYTLTLLVCALVFMSTTWRTDFSSAKTEAAKQEKHILLKFSGSDWCLPCIKMEKNVFDQQVFEEYANEHLVLVNADFPQKKKNMPSAEIIKQNETLAEQYNKEGSFPLTILLDANGAVIKKWKGYKNATPEAFIKEVKTALHE